VTKRDPHDVALQRRVATASLAAISKYGFVLAGSGALREHGFTQRPTEDVDLFTTGRYQDDFSSAVDELIAVLDATGVDVTVQRRSEAFSRLLIEDSSGGSTHIDMGVDWRSSEPEVLQIGPVLAEIDSVASKFSALYSRGEPRDYLDVDAIRQSRRFTDEELLVAAENFDPGFDRQYFAQRLMNVARLSVSETEDYALEPNNFSSLVQRLESWGSQLSNPTEPEEPSVGPAPTKTNIAPPAKPMNGPGMLGPDRGLSQ